MVCIRISLPAIRHVGIPSARRTDKQVDAVFSDRTTDILCADEAIMDRSIGEASSCHPWNKEERAHELSTN